MAGSLATATNSTATTTTTTGRNISEEVKEGVQEKKELESSDMDAAGVEETKDSSSTIASTAATDENSPVAVAAAVDGDRVNAIAGLVPLVLALTGTAEGTRCLAVMVSAGAGLGEASQAAILRQDLWCSEGSGEQADSPVVGIRGVVRMLVSIITKLVSDIVQPVGVQGMVK